MEGITDAPMRALQGLNGGFSYAVSEFLRVSSEAIPRKVFLRDVPELNSGSRTVSGLPVQVQILGGDPKLMAESAVTAVECGAIGVDINFGCPAKTVNRHDGGASLLRYPQRIRAIVSAVRAAVPMEIPVSAKLRLGWESIDEIDENAASAAEGGASWLTIHGRTKMQGYQPPAHWAPIGRVRRSLGLPIIANGDIWSFEDFLRCQDVTGCTHFMLGRGALADPALPGRIAEELGLPVQAQIEPDWHSQLAAITHLMREVDEIVVVMKLKQWLKIAHNRGTYPHFERVKRATTLSEFLDRRN
jgi:tRNA-dihydrouridine synthase C